WVALEEGEVRYQSSGTSLKAMSILLQELNRLIQEDYGTGPGLEKIEKAIRSNKKELLLHGSKVPLSEYFDKAASKVAPNALTPMKKSM
ncbi:plasmid stability protein StbA, partial [Vibrio sp. Vb2880]|nr:plasmid stability protein StbA [Vibrio sp. Vb2880]